MEVFILVAVIHSVCRIGEEAVTSTQGDNSFFGAHAVLKL